jgi:hypothetical protein
MSGVMTFAGGRGLLAVTDDDTFYQSLTFLAVLAVLWRAWPLTGWRGCYLVLTIGMAVLLAGLIAYTVVNFGTLFRLRLMVASLVWLAPLALARPLWAESRSGSAGDVRVQTVIV